MNRKNEYRAWDKNLSMMVYSKEQIGCIKYDTNPVDVVNTILNQDNYGYVFMQYTGLKDKKGKKIYEQDIIKTSCNEIKIIKYIEHYGGFKAIHSKHKEDVITDLKGLVLEVIGNVFEHKHLLEK